METRVIAKRRVKTADESDLDTLVANAREASEFLKALSHEARLMILCLLWSEVPVLLWTNWTCSKRLPFTYNAPGNKLDGFDLNC